MSRNDKDELSPGLERQLRRIEQIGNAEADLALEERRSRNAFTFNTSYSSSSTSVQEAKSKLDSTRKKYYKEAERTRKFGIGLLLLSPFFTLAYVVAGIYENANAAALCILVAGLCVGFAVPVIFYANKRQRDL